MQVSTLNQAYLFIIFCATGVLIGLVFDVFRIIRKLFKTPDFLTYIEDIFFWIISGLILIYSIFIFNNGEIRLYMFIAISLGIITYILTFSRFFVIIGYKFSNFVKKLIINILIIPFKILKKLLFRPITFISINIRNISKNFSIKFSKYITKKSKKLNIKEGL